MSWKKYFKKAPNKSKRTGNTDSFKYNNYSSILPDYYSGHPSRVERYTQYDAMDQDSEVNSALDILADFCTQTNVESKLPFKIHYHNNTDSNDSEISILDSQLKEWCSLQEFKTRIFKIVRNVFKNGDQLFIRDPETFKWYFVDVSNVEKIIVDEAAGKEIEQYVIRDIGINFENLSVAEKSTAAITNTAGLLDRAGSSPVQAHQSYYQMGQRTTTVSAEHIVHISLSEGMDLTWPFGRSLLEDVFKVYKQKELLEDAIIIYRVQRAPERRVFYIDVGNMPSHLAMGFVERIKNEIHQRRIPSQTGGGSQLMDSTYNPLSILEDYYFPQSGEGRGSKVETLPGGECLSLDTKIKLLDGRDVELEKIISEFEEGKENWVYSANPDTGEIVPGPIVWAGVTRKNAEIMIIAMNNEESVTCTPDHKFLLRNGEYIEAQNLKINDILMPLNSDEEIFVNQIEYIEKRIDTGDITVGNEFHNFAIVQGVIISNSLGQIDDLKHFTNKMFRALRIPSSYLPTGPDEGIGNFTDGRLGTALIQEYRFNEYCKRLQNIVSKEFDSEFKLFLKLRGIVVDNSIFEIQFNEPQNFAAYRQTELDQTRMSVFSNAEGLPYISKRFAMKRFLGLTEAEIAENSAMWFEENKEKLEGIEQDDPVGSDIRNVGITPGGIEGDLSAAELPDDMDLDNIETEGDIGAEGDMGGDMGGDIPDIEEPPV